MREVARAGHHPFVTSSVAWEEDSKIFFENRVRQWLPTNQRLRSTLSEMGPLHVTYVIMYISEPVKILPLQRALQYISMKNL